MRVHLVRHSTLENFAYINAQSRTCIAKWLGKIAAADWNQPGDIKLTCPSADFLGRGSTRVIFDLGGNNYRMICKYVFGRKQVHLYICWIGSHPHYDQLCKQLKQYTINIY